MKRKTQHPHPTFFETCRIRNSSLLTVDTSDPRSSFQVQGATSHSYHLGWNASIPLHFSILTFPIPVVESTDGRCCNTNIIAQAAKAPYFCSCCEWQFLEKENLVYSYAQFHALDVGNQETA